MKGNNRMIWVLLLGAGLCGCASQRMRCMRGESEEACKARIHCPREWTMEKCRQVQRDAGCTESMTKRECQEKLLEAAVDAFMD